MKAWLCLVCLLVVVSAGTMFMWAQYNYRLNSNQLTDNWGNSRWAVNSNSATAQSNVSVVREAIAQPVIQLVGYLPLVIAALLAVSSILWLAIGIRSKPSGR